MKPADQYTITPQDARWLEAIVLLPADLRREHIGIMAQIEGAQKIFDLFSEFVGMANSVVTNNREMAEIVLITDGNMHPNSAAEINLPTIFGALQGVKLAAIVDQDKLCEGCAFRLGTPANQSPITTSDAGYCSEESDRPFFCHMELDDKGAPYKGCTGYAQARKKPLKAMEREGT